jgi:hypothetical protein
MLLVTSYKGGSKSSPPNVCMYVLFDSRCFFGQKWFTTWLNSEHFPSFFVLFLARLLYLWVMSTLNGFIDLVIQQACRIWVLQFMTDVFTANFLINKMMGLIFFLGLYSHNSHAYTDYYGVVTYMDWDLKCK